MDMEKFRAVNSFDTLLQLQLFDVMLIFCDKRLYSLLSDNFSYLKWTIKSKSTFVSTIFLEFTSSDKRSRFVIYVTTDLADYVFSGINYENRDSFTNDEISDAVKKINEVVTVVELMINNDPSVNDPKNGKEPVTAALASLRNAKRPRKRKI